MSQTPLFSVIIPTFNRPVRLKACLNAIADLNFPAEAFEVIVVDDSSPVSPEPLVDELSRKIPATLVVQPHAGPATARNTGAAQATGRYLAFTDDDCRPHPDWLAHLNDALGQTPDKIIGGLTVNALPENLYATASQDLISFLYAALNANPDQAQFFTSNNMALARNLFNDLGGFDKYFPFAAAEDRDFCERWLEQGRGLGFARQAVIYHSHALTLASFFRQHFYYGRGGYHFYRLRAQRKSRVVRLQRPGFYARLLAQPLGAAQLKRPGGLRLAGLTLLSQMATAAGYAAEMLKG